MVINGKKAEMNLDAKDLKKMGYIRMAITLESKFRKTHSDFDLNALYVFLSDLEDDKEMYNSAINCLSTDVVKCVVAWAKKVNDAIFPLSMKSNVSTTDEPHL